VKESFCVSVCHIALRLKGEKALTAGNVI